MIYIKIKININSKAFIIILNILFVFQTKIGFFIFQYNSLKDKNNFDNIIPKINLRDTKIYGKDVILKSRELFISNSRLTKEYINYMKPKNISHQKLFKNRIYEGIEPDLSFTMNRTNQIGINEFFELCLKEKLISNDSYISQMNNPLVSVIIIAYNKKDIILKSIRSIQNQSLKNIEIILVDDCSTDNSSIIYKELLKTDKRIRIFTHLKNMGVWRSRLDGFLYSNSPYVIHFDAGDFYADNFILEDMYYLSSKYDLDSIRCGFRLTREKFKLNKNDELHIYNQQDRKIVYGQRSYNIYIASYGPIWDRLTKADIFLKGLSYIDDFILNAYKNVYEDRWWNTLANNASSNYLMINRIGYIYLYDYNGEGHIRHGNKYINEKNMKELILFFLFDYNLAYYKSDKNQIINQLRLYEKGSKQLKLSDIKHKFPEYEHLLNILIKDQYVSKDNKKFLLSLKHNFLSNI